MPSSSWLPLAVTAVLSLMSCHLIPALLPSRGILEEPDTFREPGLPLLSCKGEWFWDFWESGLFSIVHTQCSVLNPSPQSDHPLLSDCPGLSWMTPCPAPCWNAGGIHGIPEVTWVRINPPELAVLGRAWHSQSRQKD